MLFSLLDKSFATVFINFLTIKIGTIIPYSFSTTFCISISVPVVLLFAKRDIALLNRGKYTVLYISESFSDNAAKKE